MTQSTTRARRTQPQTCRLTLEIGPDAYAVAPLSTDQDPTLARLVRLRKLTGDAARYHVEQRGDATTCDCPGHRVRSAKGLACKHVRALRACGLLA